jgi:hypothetical protein
MGLLRIVPAPPLASIIEAIWDWDMPAAAFRYECILPSPCTSLIINLLEDETRIYQDDENRCCLRASGSVIGGPFRHSLIIDTAEQVRVMGLNFHPGGAHALLGLDADELTRRDINLEDMFGASARQLRQRLLETTLPLQRLALLERWLRQLSAAPRWDAEILHAVATLACVPEVPRISRLQRDSGYSAHRFAVLFRRHDRQAIRTTDALQRRRQHGVSGATTGRVAHCRRRRLLRPGPPQPRISPLCRHHADRIRRAAGALPPSSRALNAPPSRGLPITAALAAALIEGRPYQELQKNLQDAVTMAA